MPPAGCRERRVPAAEGAVYSTRPAAEVMVVMDTEQEAHPPTATAAVRAVVRVVRVAAVGVVPFTKAVAGRPVREKAPVATAGKGEGEMEGVPVPVEEREAVRVGVVVGVLDRVPDPVPDPVGVPLEVVVWVPVGVGEGLTVEDVEVVAVRVVVEVVEEEPLALALGVSMGEAW
jgi:hypothetical protein